MSIEANEKPLVPIGDVKVGKWYIADLWQFPELVKIKVVGKDGDYLTIKFHLNRVGFIRSKGMLHVRRLVCECNNPPSLFTNY